MWQQTVQKLYQNVKKEDVWRLWIDIAKWPLWHDDLDSCTMEGPFEVGNFFWLKPKGMKAVKIELTDIKEGFSFTDCTKFLGAKMYDTHTLEETPDGLLLTNTVVVTGPMRWLWIKLVAQNVANTSLDHMDALVALARGLHD
ncbi:SRPBCC family protein [bacterium]|nr:MAG: SRPBCC family protein [bacterium]